MILKIWTVLFQSSLLGMNSFTRNFLQMSFTGNDFPCKRVCLHREWKSLLSRLLFYYFKINFTFRLKHGMNWSVKSGKTDLKIIIARILKKQKLPTFENFPTNRRCKKFDFTNEVFVFRKTFSPLLTFCNIRTLSDVVERF